MEQSELEAQWDVDTGFVDQEVKEVSDEEEYEEGETDGDGEASSKLKVSCDTCGMRFLRKSTLKYHQMVHVDEALYACEFCPATTIHWSEFYVHQCTNPADKPLHCPQCNKIVSTKKQLAVHDEVHALQRRFTTKRLDNYFKRKLDEIEEKEVDWGAKPFLCGVCGKPFGKLYEVEYHEKLHNGERQTPHVCPSCGLFYINKQDLSKHEGKGCQREETRKTCTIPLGLLQEEEAPS